MEKPQTVDEAVIKILKDSFIGGQEELRTQLAELGHDVTQSTVSRSLKRIGAVRTYNENEEPTYSLPSDDSLPPVHSTIQNLVLGVDSNETRVVVYTKPGAASLLARHIDHHGEQCIATIAGDDMFLAVPKSIKKIKQTIDELKDLLGVEDL